MIPEYLIRHARDKVWCVPYQDHQAIIELAHLSPRAGEIGTCKVMWLNVVLPTQQDHYHVFQIGGNSPDRLGLPWGTDKWYRLQDWANTRSMVIDLYTERGIQLPLERSWVYRTENGNTVIAVQQLAKNLALDWSNMVDLAVDPLYLRLYTNEYFDTNGGMGITRPVVYGGGVMTSQAKVQALRLEVNDLAMRDGLVKVFKNGYWVDLNAISSLKLGDICEYVYDASVERVVDFRVSDLRDFGSLVDHAQKYLLHPPKDPRGQILRYRDDVDVYVYTGDMDLSGKGLYFMRNAEDSLRMVSHADYALRVDYVNAYQPWLTDANVDLYVQLHIRNGGDRNYLVPEHHRIAQLYQFDDKLIVDAMIGGDALVADFRAENLEASLYPALMRDYQGNFEALDVAYCYGRNALGVLLADSPKAVVHDNSGNYAPVGVQLQRGCTAFEYDKDGVLLSWRPFTGGERYYTQSAGAELVEFQTGLGQKAIDWFVGNDPVVLPTDVRYQIYWCPRDKGIPTEVWQPAKAGTHYDIANGTLVWKMDVNGKCGLVVTDRYVSVYEVELDGGDGNYHFTLSHPVTRAEPATLQPKRLAINVNGHWLTEGLNCVVQWPVVYITTDRYLKRTGKQKVLVRATGFCDPATMQRDVPTDVGFVVQGVVSVDTCYDLRGDRVMHAVVDGCLQLTSDVPWAETTVDGSGSGYKNGLPYMAYPAVTPVREFDESVNAALDAIENVTDVAVRDYLSKRVPMYTQVGPNPIQDFYGLYSVFFAALLVGLRDGSVYQPYKPDDKAAVRDAITSLFPLLEFDPCRLAINPNYVRIYPYPFASAVKTVTTETYRFLSNVNDDYLNGKLDLTPFFRIGETNDF